MMFIFFMMVILVIGIIKFAQNFMTFQTSVGIIDNDSSMGYQFDDPFNYTSINDLQRNWEYNESNNVYLNVTDGHIIFHTSTLLQNEQMYFRRDFNTITINHNELLQGNCDFFIENASLTGCSYGIGTMLGEDMITIGGILINYGILNAINGSTLVKLKDMESNSWQQVHLTLFLDNQTYLVQVNDTSWNQLDFAMDLSSINTLEVKVYPAASLFTSVNVTLDNIAIITNSTPELDLSINLSHYIEEQSNVIYYESESAAKEALLNWKIGAYIIIPEGFETNITQDFPVFLNITIDGTNTRVISDSLNIVNEGIINFRIGNEFLLDFIMPDIDYAFTDQIPIGPTWMALLIPPILAIAFIGSAMITTCLSLVGDQPLFRLLLSPLRKSEVLISKFFSYFLYAIIQLILYFTVWLVALPLLGLQEVIVGSIFDCYITILIFSVVGIGLGFMVSCFSRTNTQSVEGFITIFIVFISVWLFRISELDPIRLGEIAIINIMFKGLPLSSSWYQLGMLLVYAFGSIGLAYILFRHQKKLV
jgi:hypothetical protein